MRPFIDLSGSGEVPAPLPPVPATGHLDISDRFPIAPNNPITQPSVEVAPAAFAESVVGDFGVPGFLDAYHTMSILLSINFNFVVAFLSSLLKGTTSKVPRAFFPVLSLVG